MGDHEKEGPPIEPTFIAARRLHPSEIWELGKPFFGEYEGPAGDARLSVRHPSTVTINSSVIVNSLGESMAYFGLGGEHCNAYGATKRVKGRVVDVLAADIHWGGKFYLFWLEHRGLVRYAVGNVYTDLEQIPFPPEEIATEYLNELVGVQHESFEARFAREDLIANLPIKPG